MSIIDLNTVDAAGFNRESSFVRLAILDHLGWYDDKQEKEQLWLLSAKVNAFLRFVETSKMTIVQQWERHLGAIAEGWKDEGARHDLGIVRFADQPYEGASTFATIGLGRHDVVLPNGNHCGQELLFAARNDYPPDQVASFLLTLAAWFLDRNQAILRGDVIGPSSLLVPGVAVNAVYASVPAIYPDELALYTENTQSIVLVWIIPILNCESEYVRSKGWSSFEKLLESSDPDLLDFNRPAVTSNS